MINKDMLDSMVEHKRISQILVLKDFCTEVPSWQEFIDYMDESSKVTESQMPDEPNEYDLSLGAVIKGNVMSKQVFYFYITSHRHIGKTEDISRSLVQDLEAPGGLSALYINFSSNISNILNHKDALDNFYWQCIGSTEWLCNGIEYTVNPGDLVYIPANTYHAVNFSMPRAAIGFSSELYKSKLFNSDLI